MMQCQNDIAFEAQSILRTAICESLSGGTAIHTDLNLGGKHVCGGVKPPLVTSTSLNPTYNEAVQTGQVTSYKNVPYKEEDLNFN